MACINANTSEFAGVHRSICRIWVHCVHFCPVLCNGSILNSSTATPQCFKTKQYFSVLFRVRSVVVQESNLLNLLQSSGKVIMRGKPLGSHVFYALLQCLGNFDEGILGRSCCFVFYYFL